MATDHEAPLHPVPLTDYQERCIRGPEAEVEARDMVRIVLTALSPQELQVVRLRFGLGVAKEYSLSEIGQIIGGVTGERVRQIEKAAIRKMRRPNVLRRKEILRAAKEMTHAYQLETLREARAKRYADLLRRRQARQDRQDELDWSPCGEEAHDWEPIQGWKRRYRCQTCGMIGTYGFPDSITPYGGWNMARQFTGPSVDEWCPR